MFPKFSRQERPYFGWVELLDLQFKFHILVPAQFTTGGTKLENYVDSENFYIRKKNIINGHHRLLIKEASPPWPYL